MPDAFLYDVVDYPPYVHQQMHPSRLAAIARLHGVDASTPAACHLLEVGCGDGLQLLTLAMAYPDSRFVGVDLSAKAIARGDAMRAKLGLDNLQLIAADLLDWNPGPEPFDYVLAHGFWSWVPEPVRHRLLEICRDTLAENGLAYVSYNTLPGCHLRRMLWDILRFHSETASSPEERVTRALECIDLLDVGLGTKRKYAVTMHGEIEDLRKRFNPSVLFHDDLAEINDPCTLSDFLQQARAYGLEFMAEANYQEMSLKIAAEDARPLLASLAENDLATKEQYLDFLSGRRFRQSLLTRRQAAPSPKADARVLTNLHAASELKADPGANDPGGIRYVYKDNQITLDDPLLQHLLAICEANYPRHLLVATLVDNARGASASTRTRDEDLHTATEFLLGAFEVGLVELSCDPPAFTTKAGEAPRISPLARLQIESGQVRITSLVPEMGKLESVMARELALLLDGTRDRAALRRDLAARMAGIPTPQEDGTLACRTEVWWLAELPPLEAGLAELAHLGLLLD